MRSESSRSTGSNASRGNADLPILRCASTTTASTQRWRARMATSLGLCHPGSPLGGWLGWQPRPFQREAKIQAWFQNWTQWEQKITFCRVTDGAKMRATSDTVVSRFTGFEEFFGTAPSRPTHNCYFGKESPRVESSIVSRPHSPGTSSQIVQHPHEESARHFGPALQCPGKGSHHIAPSPLSRSSLQTKHRA